MKISLRNLALAFAATVFAGSAFAGVKDELQFVPADGKTVQSLDYIAVNWIAGGSLNPMNQYTPVLVTNAAGEVVAEGTGNHYADPDNWAGMDYNTTFINLHKPVTEDTPVDEWGDPIKEEVVLTEAGTYTLTFPEGYWMGKNYMAYGEEFTLTYTVDPSYVPVLDELYIVGRNSDFAAPTEENAELYADWKLVETGEGTRNYTGTFYFPAGKAEFNIFDELEGWKGKQYGAMEYDAKDFDYDRYTGDIVEGYNMFKFPVWGGGNITIAVNLNAMTISIDVKRDELELPAFHVLGAFNDYEVGEETQLAYAGQDEKGYEVFSGSIAAVGKSTLRIEDVTNKVSFGLKDEAIEFGVEADVEIGGNEMEVNCTGDLLSVIFRYNPNTEAASKLTLNEASKLALTGISLESGASLEEGASIAPTRTIYFTFNNEIADVPDDAVTLTDGEGNSNKDENPIFYAEVYTVWSNPAKIAVDFYDMDWNLLGVGNYTITIPAGSIRDAYGQVYSEDIVLNFSFRELLTTEAIAPKDGEEVDALETILFENLDGIYFSFFAYPTLYNEAGEAVFAEFGESVYDENWEESWPYGKVENVVPEGADPWTHTTTQILVTLPEKVTTPGKYTLHCPEGFFMYLSTYNYEPERNFTFIVKDSTSGVESVAAAVASEAVYYNLQGIKVAKENLTPGIYVKVAGENTSKVVIK